MKNTFHTIFASTLLLSAQLLFANGTEPNEPIKTNLNSCTNCTGDIFTFESEGIQSVRLLDEYENLIDVNELDRNGEFVYTFEASGLYYLEFVDKQGQHDRKLIIVPE